MKSADSETMPAVLSLNPGAQALPSIDLRSASPRDAGGIYALGEQVFGSLQFLYTIYQAPQSVSYLRQLLANSDPNRRITVAMAGEELVGYYDASLDEDEAFLSYIAASPKVQGRGIGTLLLNHLGSLAGEKGCRQVVLDVFQSNTAARQWYERLGFQQTSESKLARVGLSDLLASDAPQLKYDSEQLQRALSEEAQGGFSKVLCACGPGNLTVGLIGGHTCKLLAYDGISLPQAANALALRFRHERNTLVFSFAGDPPSIAENASVETVLRLSRLLSSD